MKDIHIVIHGNKMTLIKALQALQFAKIDVKGVQVGENEMKERKDEDKNYKLAEEYEGEGEYEGKDPNIVEEIIDEVL